MKSWQVETFQVAKFYGVSPQEVEGWYNFDFLDRAEFMRIQNQVDGLYDNKD